jgi:hypothetical protein
MQYKVLVNVSENNKIYVLLFISHGPYYTRINNK